jgi:hypothetical protein
MLKRVCQQGQSTPAYIMVPRGDKAGCQLRAPCSRPIRQGTSNMASLPPVIVHVEKPTGILFSECFDEIRLWLAAHNIRLVDIHLSRGYSSIGLDIAFGNSEDADLFEREFSPVVALRGF